MTFRTFHLMEGLRSVISFINKLLCGACEPETGSGIAYAVDISAEKKPPPKEVGTMGYLVIGIAYIVLTVVAVVKPRAGHA